MKRFNLLLSLFLILVVIISIIYFYVKTETKQRDGIYSVCTIDNSPWVTAGGVIIRNSEKYATHIENQLRAENGIPLRIHSGIDANSGSRVGLESTRIIRGRASLFYRQSNGVSSNGIPLLQTPFIYGR